MAATCAGLEVPRRGQTTNQGHMPLESSLGQLSERYDTHSGQMLLVREILGNLKHDAGEASCMKKPLEMAWVGLRIQ